MSTTKEVYEKYVSKMLIEMTATTEDFKAQDDFHKAWEVFDDAYAEDANMTDLAALLNYWISITSTTEQMRMIWSKDSVEDKERLGDAALTWEKVAHLALEKAHSKEDILSVMTSGYCDFDSKEFAAALDKFLEFCKCKEDVEFIMYRICGHICIFEGLKSEEHFLKIFKRGHELPSCPKEDQSGK